MDMITVQINLRGLLTALVIMLGAGLIQSSGAMAQEDGDEVTVACLRKNLPMVYVPTTEAVTKTLNGYYKREVRENRDDYECNAEQAGAWYCNGVDAIAFQGLDGQGENMESGLLCENNGEIPLQKFYSREFLALHSCIDIDWSDPEYLNIYPLGLDE